MMSQGSNITMTVLETAEQENLTSSRTMADIKAIKRFRLNSWPVESTAADLKEKNFIKNEHSMSLFDDLISQKNHYLSTSVSKMIPKSALLSRTAWVIAFIAVLSSGFGI